MFIRMTFTVAVAGASGYAGGETLRLLAAHPQVAIGALTANTSAGTRLGEHHPHLRSLADRELVATDAAALAGHDVVVLALPHGASGAIAAELRQIERAGSVVLDLGADHRLVDAADWRAYYGSEHAGTWTYGMPELIRGGDLAAGDTQRARLAGTDRIAVPGCNVTAVTLGLQPGVATGLVDTDDLVAVLAVGYSGAGKGLKPHLQAAEALGSAQPYAVGGTHRHIPEIVQNLRAAGAGDVAISFTPVLVPMSRGILATVTAPVGAGVSTAQAREVWRTAYADEPFVEVLPDDVWPTTAMVVGANTALVQVAVDAKAGRLVTVTAIDNLVKGTAGGAVQSMNLALGLPETTGLVREGVAP
ncbi:MAG: N-acetyl-gamma-glutamyl-phosphate reductase [Cellulomonas sp.]|jgi:N-acetyl-gamma-glutamyl-phosphate reductase|nr:N-acetyl-gamma-glutamyl-phosphate reductase [Cellulomonas sp.]